MRTKENGAIGFKQEIISDNVLGVSVFGTSVNVINRTGERDRAPGTRSVRLNRNVFVAQSFRRRLGQYFGRRDGSCRYALCKNVLLFYGPVKIRQLTGFEKKLLSMQHKGLKGWAYWQSSKLIYSADFGVRRHFHLGISSITSNVQMWKLYFLISIRWLFGHFAQYATATSAKRFLSVSKRIKNVLRSTVYHTDYRA